MGRALHTPGPAGVGAVSAAEARLDDAGLLAVQGPSLIDIRTGVLHGPGSTALVTSTTDTAPMAYLVAPHHWNSSRGVNSDGVYRGALAVATRVTTTAAPGSGTRTDVIWVKQNDQNSTLTPDANDNDVYGCTQGAVGGGKPAIPVGALELATATVAAGAVSTASAQVTITNTARQTVAHGAPIPVRSTAERTALQNAWGATGGLSVKRLDVAGFPMEEWDGAGWRRYRMESDTGWVTAGLTNGTGFGNRGGAGYRIIDGLHAYAQVTVERTGADLGPANASGNSAGGISDAPLYTLPAPARPSTGQPVFGRAYAYFGSGTVMLEASGVVSLIDMNPAQIVPTGGLVQTYFAYVLG